MKSLTCREVGFDCPSVIKGNTESEVIQMAKEHTRSVHNIKPEDMSPEMQHKIIGLIRTTSPLS
jgi:predicted small metal-binding protein